jgi:hypothetical protein
MNVNLEVLSDLTKQMTEGERVKPSTEEENLCFKLINDLDHINGHVPGSITQKKYMRNEIWSLISYFEHFTLTHTFPWTPCGLLWSLH